MVPGTRIKGLTAALLLTAAVHPAAGQSLVSTVDNPFQVAASYGYSQVNHAGNWILVDVAVQSKRSGTMRLHKAFSLLTPDGKRIDLPSQQQYRAGLEEINAMQAPAELMQVSTVVGSPGCTVIARARTDRRRACFPWKLWGNGGVTWTATIGPGRGPGRAALYFHSPDGWPAGEYWLEVDGPGDLEARLPVRLH